MDQPMDVKIGIGQGEDRDAIAAFQVAMALETENMHLDPPTVQAGVQRLFDAHAPGFYVVAKIGDEAIASLLILSEWSDWRNREVWWIHSVYVKPEHRRKGVYQRLYAWVKAEAHRKNIAGLRLYVDKRNEGAQKTYTRLGMNQEHYLLFEEMLT